ncbi:TlpA family protein disulfide reductase [Flavobacterium franklandianum]|uniref:TlpA family protein disulfide reductase n=1 Tax=Flavobacterium franklandianum TaxID=2594430 RepID=UPI001179E739|nr:TlpA disulfide reductase family protein [Flavobacterium franklandianum]TRX28932.1 TlpA family protein disulfide reductase [Flavobacterium franklandianum]
MKNYSFLLLIVMLSSFTTPKATITLSGKITNVENGTIWIKGESFEKEINLKPDGTFLEKLPIDYEGIYSIETSKNRMPIYFSKDSKMSLTADDSNFNATLKYTGKGSIENQYINKKLVITSEISFQDFKLNESDFLKKLQKTINSVKNLFQTTKFSDDSFKQKETLNLHYLEQRNILFYNRFNNKVSVDFPKYDEKMDLDIESDFLFSWEYQDIVMTKFYENIKGDGISFVSAKNAIPEIKALKSQSIKNRLILYSINDINIENTNYKNTYNEFISITNDPKIKESLTFNYNNANNFLAVQTGEPSPTFNYENQKGGKTSLESLKGKYIYIDVWATWCGPCIKEIPFLEKVEEQFQGKNILFVSISIDNSKDREKWSDFVSKKQMNGIQLLADKESDSKFVKEYNIQSIPRFILIDSNGNIVNANAPSPSDPKLVELLSSLQL